MRAAALRFLAVAMATSSSQAVQDLQAPQSTQQHLVSPCQHSSASSALAYAASQAHQQSPSSAKHRPSSPGSDMCTDLAGSTLTHSPNETAAAAAAAGQQDHSEGQLTAPASTGLGLVPGGEHGGNGLEQPRGWQSQQGFAGPLMLQSGFAAGQYRQDIWDFGVEQLLLQGAFWEQLSSLQVSASKRKSSRC